MATHELDDGGTVYNYIVDENGNLIEQEITDPEGRFQFFENVAAERLRLLRKERNAKLAETDWMVAKSSEMGVPIPPEWAAYRQALRDITDTYKSQFDVVWPVKPE